MNDEDGVEADSDEGDVPDPDYVSCVRINGRPILPPVMTPELRQVKSCSSM